MPAPQGIAGLTAVWRVRLITLAGLLVMAQAVFNQAAAFTIELTADDLQGHLDQQFPIKKETPFFTLTLSQPRVMLREDSDRIGIELDVSTLTFGGLTAKARGLMDGQLRYERTTGEFFLLEPEIHRLTIADLPQEYQREVQALVESVAKETLARIPIYQLDKNDPQQARAKSLLKSVSVDDGILTLEFSLFNPDFSLAPDTSGNAE